MKKIYYLIGMPRAGNTLFGSLLNQNPRVRVTANSLVSEIMWLTGDMDYSSYSVYGGYGYGLY